MRANARHTGFITDLGCSICYVRTECFGFSNGSCTRSGGHLVHD